MLKVLSIISFVIVLVNIDGELLGHAEVNNTLTSAKPLYIPSVTPTSQPSTSSNGGGLSMQILILLITGGGLLALCVGSLFACFLYKFFCVSHSKVSKTPKQARSFSKQTKEKNVTTNSLDKGYTQVNATDKKCNSKSSCITATDQDSFKTNVDSDSKISFRV